MLMVGKFVERVLGAPLLAILFEGVKEFAALVFVVTMDVDVHIWLLTIVMFVFGTSLANTGTVANHHVGAAP